jgi:hypothetical protein
MTSAYMRPAGTCSTRDGDLRGVGTHTKLLHFLKSNERSVMAIPRTASVLGTRRRRPAAFPHSAQAASGRCSSPGPAPVAVTTRRAGRRRPTTSFTRSARSGAPVARQSWHRTEPACHRAGAIGLPQAKQLTAAPAVATVIEKGWGASCETEMRPPRLLRRAGASLSGGASPYSPSCSCRADLPTTSW